jgi:hypothetical protein
MGNMNDIDADLTKRFDSGELRSEMERMARANRAQTAARRAVERRESERRQGDRRVSDRRVAERRTADRRYSDDEMSYGFNGISEGEVRRRPQQSSNGRRPVAKKKKSSGFKKGIIKYIALLCVLSFIFLAYVMNTLYQYEDSFSDNYMQTVVKDITKKGKKGKISKLVNVKDLQVNPLDNSKKNVDKAFKELFKTSEITYKLDDKTKNSDNPVYYVYANDKKIMDVTLKVKERKHRLGLFTYPVWKVDSYKLTLDRGLEYYDIRVPSNYTVEVNGTKLDSSYISENSKDEDYDKFAEYAKLPTMVNYELNNFVQTPTIKIKDEKGNEVNTLIKDNKIEIESSYKTASSYEEAKKYLKGDIDILQLAENWSLFLTDDLVGGQHGFATLKPYLIKGSNFYDMAYQWATSIDITFVSNHSLKNPAFTNESVTDFVIYGENAFSCSVNLEKNMRIANGKDKVDVMHDKLYFVYYDDTDDGKDNGSWKLIDMKSIVENKGN